MADVLLGRPTKFKPEYCEQAKKLCLLGHTDKELSEFFEISEQTLNTWKQKYPAFMESLKAGKDVADADITASLYQSAKGYSHNDTHISVSEGKVTKTPIKKHYPPNPTSCIFWLKNRQPKRWRDRQEVTGADGTPIIPDAVSDLELGRRLAFLLEKAARAALKGEDNGLPA